MPISSVGLIHRAKLVRLIASLACDLLILVKGSSLGQELDVFAARSLSTGCANPCCPSSGHAASACTACPSATAAARPQNLLNAAPSDATKIERRIQLAPRPVP